MAKTYWIARVDVSDVETYKKYVETGKPAFERYNAKFLARGGKAQSVEGAGRGRNVIIEFASLEDALQLENRTQILANATEDAAEARAAFLEKRQPNFTGR